MKMTKTTLSTKAQHDWVLIDAENQTLGRMATGIAFRLMGKHKNTYTPNVDMGDQVIVINAGKVKISGKKAESKVYHHYTGWSSGLKETKYSKLMEETPEKIIRLAVQRMLPKGTMGKMMFRKLHVYADGNHPHVAQKPTTIKGDK
jgi:large subunit ribosomal protein L13